MKAILRSLGVVLMVATLTACGSSSNSTQKKVDDANAKIPRLNEISQSLHVKGIDLGTYGTPTIKRAMTENDIETSKVELKEFLRLGNEVMSTTSEKDVFFSDQGKLRTMLDNAGAYLSMLENYKVKVEAPAVVESTQTILDRAKAENTKMGDLMLEVLNKYAVSLATDPDKKTQPFVTNRLLIEKMSLDSLKDMKSRTDGVLESSTRLLTHLDTLSGRSNVNQTALDDMIYDNKNMRTTIEKNLEVIEKALEAKSPPSAKPTEPMQPIAVGQ